MVKDQIIQYAKTGDYTTKELAKLSGLSITTIQRYLSDHGLKAKWGKVNMVKFKEMASSGATLAELSEAFSISREHASMICKRYNLQPKTRKVDVDKFKEACAVMSIERVAEHFGITLKYARRLRRRVGMAPKPRRVSEWLIAAAKTGKYSTVDLSHMFGITVEWAYMLCRRNGIEPRSCYEPPEATKEPEPTLAEPGSPEKIEVLRRRFENGEKLWHPWDKVV